MLYNILSLIKIRILLVTTYSVKFYAFLLSSSSYSSIYLDNPKSHKLIEQSSFANIFDGLISLWSIYAECK